MNRTRMAGRRLSAIAAGATLSAGMGLSLLAGPASAAEGPAAAGQGQRGEKHAEITKCLKDAGITLPAGPRVVRRAVRADPAAIEAKRAEIDAALKKCGITRPTKEELTARHEAMRSCLAEQGVEVPDRQANRSLQRRTGEERRDDRENRRDRRGPLGAQHEKIHEAVKECRQSVGTPAA